MNDAAAAAAVAAGASITVAAAAAAVAAASGLAAVATVVVAVVIVVGFAVALSSLCPDPPGRTNPWDKVPLEKYFVQLCPASYVFRVSLCPDFVHIFFRYIFFFYTIE